MKWECSEFKLLGINFKIALEEMPKSNFEQTLNKIQKCINFWEKHNLTILGKITVLKTLVLPKFNHMFMCLQNPDNEFISRLEKIFFKFIWNGKPDKIQRSQLTNSYEKGGMKMINIKAQISAFKISWIKRLILSESMFKDLFEEMILPIDKIVCLGPLVFKDKKIDFSNPFWKDVFYAWTELFKNFTPDNESNIFFDPIWYNPKFSDNIFYHKNLYENGVFFIHQLLDPQNNILHFDLIKNKARDQNFHFLDFAKLKMLIKKYKNNLSIGFKNVPYTFPFIPNHIQATFQECRQNYIILNNSMPKFIFKERWNKILDTEIDEETWKKYFKICHTSSLSHEEIWFQYKVINRILGTNAKLFKFKITKTALCPFCPHIQTLEHLFVECPYAINIWLNLNQWLKKILQIDILFDASNILLGYLVPSHSIEVNSLIILSKRFIFNASSQKRIPNFQELKGYIKHFCVERSQVYNGGENIWSIFLDKINTL
jgi:hypothetical protein